jgi:hypothetical protein
MYLFLLLALELSSKTTDRLTNWNPLPGLPLAHGMPPKACGGASKAENMATLLLGPEQVSPTRAKCSLFIKLPSVSPCLFFYSPVVGCDLIGARFRCIGSSRVRLIGQGDPFVFVESELSRERTPLAHRAGFAKGNCRQLPEGKRSMRRRKAEVAKEARRRDAIGGGSSEKLGK